VLGPGLVCDWLGELLSGSGAPAPVMLDQSYSLPASASEILGDLTAFAEQLGSAGELGHLAVAAASLGATPVNSAQALESFLHSYAANVLVNHEAPAVIRAREHAARGQVRELIALDKQLSAVPVLENFVRASSSVGQTQLRRLRPLRGERVVHRYLQAIEAGEARGWHTLVYGVVLAVYSIPLRQGLVHFAHRTLDGFVQAAARRLALSEADQDRVLAGPIRFVASGLEDELKRLAPGPLLLT
jgi:urease accessory protein UreF